MKRILFMSVALVAVAASAAETIEPAVRLQAFSVASVTAVNELVGRGPETHVVVTAFFPSDCAVPKSEELVLVQPAPGTDRDTLVLTVASNSKRTCDTVEDRHVQATFDLGTYVHPADGSYRKVQVNGQEALVGIGE